MLCRWLLLLLFGRLQQGDRHLDVTWSADGCLNGCLKEARSFLSFLLAVLNGQACACCVQLCGSAVARKQGIGHI